MLLLRIRAHLFAPLSLGIIVKLGALQEQPGIVAVVTALAATRQPPHLCPSLLGRHQSNHRTADPISWTRRRAQHERGRNLLLTSHNSAHDAADRSHADDSLVTMLRAVFRSSASMLVKSSTTSPTGKPSLHLCIECVACLFSWPSWLRCFQAA